jgi:hypothetical protein
MLLKHSHKSIASRSLSPSQEYHLTRHKDSPLKHLPSSLGHLDAASTKELLHQGRGSPRPPHKVSSPLHTKPEGRWQLLVSHLGPKASGEPCTPWFTQESPHKIGTTLHSLSSKLSLALSVYTKHMQVYGWANYTTTPIHRLRCSQYTPLYRLTISRYNSIPTPHISRCKWRRYNSIPTNISIPTDSSMLFDKLYWPMVPQDSLSWF